MTGNLSRDEQLRGRQNVRNALRNFTSECLVFYNPKINIEEMNDLYDRPLDIVLFHRTKGLMGVAIKSGEIVEENGTLVSQYQPSKQYYKIIDPIKQAKKAMIAFLDDCDPSLKEYVPINVVVFYPDTHQSEFTTPSPMFLFEEHLGMRELQSHMLDLFVEPWDTDKALKYAANATRVKEYLKNHSDNNIERVERKETLTKLGVREEKKAYQLPQKPTPGAANKAAATGRGAQRGQAQAKTKVSQPRPSNQMSKAVRVNPDLAAPPIAVRKRVDLSIEPDRGVFGFLHNIEDRIKSEERVELSGGQWGMMIAIAAIIVCVAYFIGRNAGIILHSH